MTLYYHACFGAWYSAYYRLTAPAKMALGVNNAYTSSKELKIQTYSLKSNVERRPFNC